MKLITFAILLAIIPSTWGTTFNSDGSPSNIQTLHSQAQNGDTITLPTGTFTWTTGITISKGITIQGAGAGSTTIRDAITNSTRLMDVTPPNGTVSRITGIKFMDGGRAPASDVIHLNGVSPNGGQVRFDHNDYNPMNGLFLCDTAIGVIDHNTWTQSTHAGFFFYGNHWNGAGAGFGDEAWSLPTGFGTSQFLFMEDNVFTGTSVTELLPLSDGYHGARFVFRHNTINNMYFANHGTESTGRVRGTRAMEVYNNNFVGRGVNRYIVGIRSGCLLVHDNTISGYWGGSTTIAFVNYRNIATFRPWDTTSYSVDGTGKWDNNDPTVYFSGTAASASSGLSVTASGSPGWTVDQWKNYTIRRTTPNTHIGNAVILSNTSDTLSYTGTGGLGNNGFGDLTFAVGDAFTIRKVNHALDQPGVGQGGMVTGNDQSPIPSWPAGQNDQAVDPMYFWNNIVTDNGNQNVSVIENSTGGCRQGVNWFNGTPKPGYSPYIYPHPLVSGAPTPTATPSATITPTVTPTATATSTPTPTAAPNSLLNGLQFYYKLEDVSDSSGNGLTLTNNNTVTFVAGKVNNAANFVAASSQSLTHADNAHYQPGTGDWSVSAWVKWSTSGGSYGFVNYGYADSTGGWAIQQISDRLVARIGDGTHNVFIFPSGTYNDGAWHLVIATYHRSGNMELFADNVSLGTANITSVTGSVVTSSIGFQIGTDATGGLLQGNVDEVMGANRVWTSDEIAEIWNSGAGTTYPFTGPTPTATPTATATATSTPTATPTATATAAGTPTAPTGLQVIPTKTLQWTANPGNEVVTTYKVYRTKHGGADLVDTVVNPLSAVSSFLNAKQTRFYVTAVNDNGEGPKSSNITIRQ